MPALRVAMPEYRRIFVPGGTFFFTIVTQDRRPLFADESNVDLLRAAVRNEREHHPFTIISAVVLPDHLHIVWTMPDDDSDYSGRIGRIKVAFTKSLGLHHPNQPATLQRGYSGVWQPRFWEHWIRDQDDLNNHLDYIHYNPVKHGYARCPHEWVHSSFHQWVRSGGYVPTWCCSCDGRRVEPPDFGAIAERCGE